MWNPLLFASPLSFIPIATTISSLQASPQSAMTQSSTNAVIPLIINNESVTTDIQFEVHNPTTGNLLGQCASASVEDAKRAVDTANAAFPAWSKMKAYDRRDILLKAAGIMASRKEELISYQREETGAGRPFADHTVNLGVSFIKDFAARIPTIEGVVPNMTMDGEGGMVFKIPYGVILSIAPW